MPRRDPDRELDDMAELAIAGEPGVALESLATQLLEHDAMPRVAVVDEIRAVGRLARGGPPRD